MGLDVYLKKVPDGIDPNTDDETSYDACEDIQMDSKIHPENICSLGYFRSSYNQGGINSVLANLLGENSDLYWIFKPNDEYVFFPEWEKSLERAKDVLKRFRKIAETGRMEYGILEIGVTPIVPVEMPHSKKEAMDILIANIQKHEKDSAAFRSYGCREGEFFLDGLNVVAICPGDREFIRNKEPCVYVLYKREGGKDDKYASYEHSLEIVIETIEYVLKNQGNGHKFGLAWSG